MSLLTISVASLVTTLVLLFVLKAKNAAVQRSTMVFEDSEQMHAVHREMSRTGSGPDPLATLT